MTANNGKKDFRNFLHVRRCMFSDIAAPLPFVTSVVMKTIQCHKNKLVCICFCTFRYLIIRCLQICHVFTWKRLSCGKLVQYLLIPIVSIIFYYILQNFWQHHVKGIYICLATAHAPTHSRTSSSTLRTRMSAKSCCTDLNKW